MLLTVPMLSGLCGLAVSGSSADKSMLTAWAYAASSSGRISIKSASLCWARRNCLVISSLGKMDVVTPHSAPILVMVARSGTVSELAPSPPYSKITPTFPLVVKISSTLRIKSLAETHGDSFPDKLMRTTFGQTR